MAFCNSFLYSVGTKEEGSVSGPFGLLSLEIQEEILRRLSVSDLASVEASSSYFRALVLDGNMWRKKAETIGREALAVMNKGIDEIIEMVEIIERIRTNCLETLDMIAEVSTSDLLRALPSVQMGIEAVMMRVKIKRGFVKEVVRRKKLEKLLAEQEGTGKEKMRALQQFMSD